MASADIYEGLCQKVQAPPRNLPERLATLGLGCPRERAILFATVVTAASYAAKWPSFFFTEQGSLKRFAIDPDEEEREEATQLHFAIVPVAAFAFAYVFL